MTQSHPVILLKHCSRKLCLLINEKEPRMDLEEYIEPEYDEEFDDDRRFDDDL